MKNVIITAKRSGANEQYVRVNGDDEMQPDGSWQEYSEVNTVAEATTMNEDDALDLIADLRFDNEGTDWEFGTMPVAN